MKKIMAMIVTLLVSVTAIVGEPAPVHAGTTVLSNSIAIMSTVTGCRAGGGWWSKHHLYTNFDGGLMRIESSSWAQIAWRPNGYTNVQSTYGFYELFVNNSASKATFSVGATLRITQTVWPGGVVYRYAQATAQRPNC